MVIRGGCSSLQPQQKVQMNTKVLANILPQKVKAIFFSYEILLYNGLNKLNQNQVNSSWVV